MNFSINILGVIWVLVQIFSFTLWSQNDMQWLIFNKSQIISVLHLITWLVIFFLIIIWLYKLIVFLTGFEVTIASYVPQNYSKKNEDGSDKSTDILNKEWKEFDKASILDSYIKNNVPRFRVSNRLFWDTFHSEGKKLDLTYWICGERKAIELYELQSKNFLCELIFNSRVFMLLVFLVLVASLLKFYL